MQNVLDHVVINLTQVPSIVWWMLVLYLGLIVAVYLFGIPFKRTGASSTVSRAEVSHIFGRKQEVVVSNAIYTEANVITTLGIFGQMVMVWIIVTETYTILLSIIFLIANVLVDGLDGMACSRYNCHSKLGEYLDPVNDRFAIIVIILVILLYRNGYFLIPLVATVVCELVIIQTAREAYRLNIPHSSVGAGQVRQVVHLVTVEIILVTYGVSRINTTVTSWIIFFALLCLVGGSLYASFHYCRYMHFAKMGQTH